MENKEKKEGKPFEAFDIINLDPTKSVFEDDMNINFSDTPPVKAEVKKDEEEEEIEIKETKEVKVEKKEVKKETKKEEIIEDDPDGSEDDEDEPEGVKSNEEVEEDDKSVYRVFAEGLSEKGLIVYDAEKFNDSEEGLESAIEETIQTGINSYVESLPEEFKQMLDFYNSGGNLRDFSKVFFEGLDYSKIDINEESNQKNVIREALRLAGESDADISDMIDEWSDLGTLEKHAKRSLVKLEKYQEEQKEHILATQKAAAERQREQAKKEWDAYKESLYSKNDILGFKLTQKAKDELWDFIAKPDKKTGLTGLQMHNSTNKDAQFLYAWLAKNNWNIDSLKKSVKTEVTSTLSKKLKNVTDTRNKISKGSSEGYNSEKRSNFSAFRQAL